MIGRLETTGTKIDIEAVDGYVTVTIHAVHPESLEKTGVKTLSCLTKVKAIQLAQLLTAAAKDADVEAKPKEKAPAA